MIKNNFLLHNSSHEKEVFYLGGSSSKFSIHGNCVCVIKNFHYK